LTRTGDLLALALAGEFDVIIQGCNCHCSFGRGIAAAIRRQFPEAAQADLGTAKGDRAKLGTISCADIVRPGAAFTIVNAYTQFDYHGSGVLADYDSIRSAFRSVRARFSGKRIAYPRIGAGLAKGDWNTIESIIAEELAGESHTLVVLPD
ncbi:MAG: macro domain-containing protein, partial [Phycisphaeraceae bacterium]|nr:macro domain-containing protein [Phycisphaeraceae bacterium]